MRSITLSIILTFFIFFGVYAQSEVLINTGNFHSIKINQPIDVYLHQSDSSYIQLKGNSVQAERVQINNQSGILRIHVSGSANMNSKVHIYSPTYKKIEVSGATNIHTIGQIQSNVISIDQKGASDAKLNISCNILKASISGASDLSIYGQVDSIYLLCSGASDFDAYGTKNIYTEVEASGSSDVKVNADSVLIAQISGASELRFKKEPGQKSINASGSSEYSMRSNTIDNADFEGMVVEENGDTTRIDLGNGRSEIIIIDGEDGVRIKKYKGNRIRFKGNWAGLELGINGYLTPSGSLNMPEGYEFMELKYERSTNFNINFFQQSINIIDNHFGLVTGLGIKWNNYRFTDNVILTPDSGELYGYYDLDTEKSYLKSKLTASYLMIPILFEYQTNPYHNSSSFHISVGVIGGVRLGSHTKQVYNSVAGKNKPKLYDSFYLQPFVLDATARIGWGPINLFATYSVIEMFRKDQGPVLHPFTVGIILPFT